MLAAQLDDTEKLLSESQQQLMAQPKAGVKATEGAPGQSVPQKGAREGMSDGIILKCQFDREVQMNRDKAQQIEALSQELAHAKKEAAFAHQLELEVDELRHEQTEMKKKLSDVHDQLLTANTQNMSLEAELERFKASLMAGEGCGKCSLLEKHIDVLVQQIEGRVTLEPAGNLTMRPI